MILGSMVLGLSAGGALADVTLRVRVPANTPSDARVYIAGDFQSWNPGDPDHALARIGERMWEITLPLENGQSIQYKFTLGDWSRVEKGPGGQEIQNRLLKVQDGQTVELEVAGWAQGEQRRTTRVGDIREITVPGFLEGRRVWVYLPPGYDDDPERRYPVLYMFDGQNVFDDATSFAGEWKVDEALEELIPAGRVAPLIVVAVDNGGDKRTEEYTPWYSSSRESGGGGRKHLERWIETLLPYIDASYRTLTGPEDTGLAGSSLGGLMTLYGVYAHPEVFGIAGSFSPTLHWASDRLVDFIGNKEKPAGVIYMDMGTREWGNLRDEDGNGSDDGIDSLLRMQDLLGGQGFVGGWDLMVVQGDEHRHNEQYWAQRFPAAVEFLFPAIP